MAQKKAPADTERKKTQSDCVTEAIWAGAKSSAWAGATSGSLVLLANQYWPAFRSSLGVSGKTALIVTPIFGMYFLQAELTINECSRRRKWTEKGAENIAYKHCKDHRRPQHLLAMLNEEKSTVAFFPVESVHAIAAASAAACVALNVAVHYCTPLYWSGYHGLPYKTKLAWCNRVVSAIHACVLIWNQWETIFNPVMMADPLHAVTDRHFIWSSVCYGYIIYDTIYEATRTLYEKAANASFLLHHAMGLACCCVGLYLRRMAYFGAVIQVFFEATTPFMHALGCMKIMGWENSTTYAAGGLLFAAMYLNCRVVISNYFGWVMLQAVLAEEAPSVWDWGGVALYSMLSVLNAMWFMQICSMIVNRLQKRKAAKHSTLSSHGSAQKQVYSDQKPAGLARVDNIKGTTGAGDTFQLRERQHASIPSAV